jgi:hypothetical protein
MQLKQHIIASAAISAGIYAATKSADMAISSYITGVFIDIDHLIDYWRDRPFNFNLPKFFSTCKDCDLTKTSLALHSFELLMLTVAAAFLTRSVLLAGIAFGLCQHLALDQLTNKVYPKSYFFIYRWRHGFKSGSVFSNKTNGNN